MKLLINQFHTSDRIPISYIPGTNSSLALIIDIISNQTKDPFKVLTVSITPFWVNQKGISSSKGLFVCYSSFHSSECKNIITKGWLNIIPHLKDMVWRVKILIIQI
jgi:hypothetical protein